MVTTSVYPDGDLTIGGSATVAYTSGAPNQVASDIGVFWDMDNDGDFSESEEDITEYVMAMDMTTGRDFPSQVNGHSSAGTLSITLDNSDDRFTRRNPDSPYNTGDFTLKTGRRIQVRVDEAADPQPTLLIRDRFQAATAGPLVTDELGTAWEDPISRAWTMDGNGQAIHNLSTDASTPGISIIDTGATDYFVMARMSQVGLKTSGLTGNEVGIIFRWQDSNDFSRVVIDVDDGQVQVIDQVAGVDTTVDTAGIEVCDDFMIGVFVSGSTYSIYLDGVVIDQGTALQTDETHVGLFGQWGHSRQPTPGIDLFEVWSGLQQPTEGVLFTGEVESLKTSMNRAHEKTAELRGVGRIQRLVDASVDRFPFVVPQGSSFLVGRVLNQLGLLSPPQGTSNVAGGTANLGMITSTEPTVNALNQIRDLETAEKGMLYERPEGGLSWAGFAARPAFTRSNTVQAWFSDEDGSVISYEEIEPLDSLTDIVNQVKVGVAAESPTATYTSWAAQTAAGVTNHITVTYGSTPTAGALYVFIIAATVGTANQVWRSPSGYTEHRNLAEPAALSRIRIYSRVMDGTEPSVTFYNDTGPSGGNYRILQIGYEPGNWFGAPEGFHVSEVTEGSDPGPVFTPWGDAPTSYVTLRCGMGSSAGAAISGAIMPLGYTQITSDFDNGSIQAFDLGMQSARLYKNIGFEDPGSFGGTFSGFTVTETVTIAVRGWNGDPPESSGAAELIVDDIPAQDDHGGIRSLDATGGPFSTEAVATAYATDVINEYKNERPIIALKFTATKNIQYRNLAKYLRLNDLIQVQTTGNSGMGFTQLFYIEQISHIFSNGNRLWEVRLELSPA